MVEETVSTALGEQSGRLPVGGLDLEAEDFVWVGREEAWSIPGGGNSLN